MSLGRTLYRTATRAVEPFLGFWLRKRARSGKEVADRLNERFAKAPLDITPSRLVWMHGASIGETRLLLEIASELLASEPDLYFLFTSQTRTSGDLIERHFKVAAELGERARHQFAPVDTPSIAERFLDQWQPRLCVFAESEIWPNLISAAQRREIPVALINARMTRKSLSGWQNWSKFSREVFNSFDLIIAADGQTASGLTDLRHSTVPTYGNLKSALKARDPDSASLTDISISFVGGRKCLVAVSTHEGEEAWLLEAARGIEPQPAIILIPRHPERREKIIRLLDERSFSYSVRSRGDAPSPAQDVLLADTLGEVGLFAKLADTVYLGGGHAPNVGGHNPVEILRLERPVMTGPDTFNFLDLNRGLEGDCGFKIVRRPEDLIASFPLPRPSAALIDRLEEQANEPMMRTVEALQKLLRRVTQ